MKEVKRRKPMIIKKKVVNENQNEGGMGENEKDENQGITIKSFYKHGIITHLNR